MAPRTFEDLVAIFPELGREGAREECRQSPLPQYLKASTDAAESGYDPALCEALDAWVRNNAKLVPYLADCVKLGEDGARRAFVVRRGKELEGIFESEGDLAEAVSSFVDLYEKHTRQILAGFENPCFPGRGHVIARGFALPEEAFKTYWAVGKTIRFDIPTAFTLNTNLVPLHFAWKQFTQGKPVGDPGGFAAVILEVEIQSHDDCPLLWTSFFEAALPGMDFRWQQEVITPPNFEISIKSQERLSVDGALHRLMAHGTWLRNA